MIKKKYLLSICYLAVTLTSLHAQTNPSTSDSSLFYKEDQTENQLKFEVKKQLDIKYDSEEQFFSAIINRKKPVFLTKNSLFESQKNEDDNEEREYHSVFKLDSNDHNELLPVLLNFKEVLYPIGFINDTIVEAKTNSDIYYISKSAIGDQEVSSTPLEFNEAFLNPAYFYFIKFKNDPGIQHSIQCYVTSKLNDYEWVSEFDKMDYINSLSKKIYNHITNNSRIENDGYFKIFEATFDTYNFEDKSYNVSIENLLDQSEFFENDFRNTISFKNIDSNTTIGEYFEFKCNELNARKIADLFGSDRKLFIKIGLTSVTNTRLSNCDDYEYQNAFFVKSLIISSDSSFNDVNVVRLNFE